MKKLSILFLLISMNAQAYSLMECSLFEGPVLLKKETALVDTNNQSVIHFGEVRGIQFKAYSLDEFVVIFAESSSFRFNSTGNMSSSIAVYGEPGANDTLVVSCELDPSEEKSI